MRLKILDAGLRAVKQRYRGGKVMGLIAAGCVDLAWVAA
jgi:hypothetical protein